MMRRYLAEHFGRGRSRPSGVTGCLEKAGARPIQGVVAGLWLAGALLGCGGPDPSQHPSPGNGAVGGPAWAQGAVFYQIFPERFRNGDVSNDPVREWIEYPERVPSSWRLRRWTSDWYAPDDWELEMGDFYRSIYHRRYGGDLQGVLDRLDYLSDLGVDAVYFNPVFWARSLHKYDGNSFHHIDPFFGPDPSGDLEKIEAELGHDPGTWVWTRADSLFLRLVSEAHRRNIRIVIDGVFNHTGRDFFAFADLRRRQQASPYRDWYTVRQFDDPSTSSDEFDYAGWWGAETLPEFADNERGTDLHPGPKKYVFDATARWMDPDGDGDPSDGIDGWRLDVAADVPIGFWADWNRHVRALNPDALTVAELWEDAGRSLPAAGFSSTMNYYAFAFPAKAFFADGTLSGEAFMGEMQSRTSRYAEAFRPVLWNLLDSHDTARFASMVVNPQGPDYEEPGRFDFDWGGAHTPMHNTGFRVRSPDADERAIQRLAVLFQMTAVGAPLIYYGSEVGMWGGDDPDDRMPMIWEDLSFDDQIQMPFGRNRAADRVAFDHDLHSYYRMLVGLRAEHPALRKGSFEPVHSPAADRAIAFVRRAGGQSALVVINREERPVSARIEYSVFDFAADAQPSVASREEPVTVIRRDEHGVVLEVPSLSGAVYLK